MSRDGEDASMSTMPDISSMGIEEILHSFPDGVYITDRDRRILFWNRAAEDITGWHCAEVVGHRCRDNILCHVDKDGHLLCGREHCPLHRAMVTGETSAEPHLIFGKRRDGRRIPVEVTVSPIRNHQGEVMGGIEVFRDLSPAFQDLNRARIIQMETVGLTLPPDPRVAVHIRYTPHDQVGGDFYRVDALDDRTVAFMLADVVGHGVSAALYAMQLRTLWEEGRDLLTDPRSFLGWLSHRVENLTDTDAGYFATALQGVYHADSGILLIGSAGHPSPLLICHGGASTQVAASGPALGLIPEPSFTVAKETLSPGDALLAYTDGAFEVTDRDGSELGEERLSQMVASHDLAGGDEALSVIEESLLKFCGGLSLPDDLTLLLVRRTA